MRITNRRGAASSATRRRSSLTSWASSRLSLASETAPRTGQGGGRGKPLPGSGRPGCPAGRWRRGRAGRARSWPDRPRRQVASPWPRPGRPRDCARDRRPGGRWRCATAPRWRHGRATARAARQRGPARTCRSQRRRGPRPGAARPELSSCALGLAPPSAGGGRLPCSSIFPWARDSRHRRDWHRWRPAVLPASRPSCRSRCAAGRPEAGASPR